MKGKDAFFVNDISVCIPFKLNLNIAKFESVEITVWYYDKILDIKMARSKIGKGGEEEREGGKPTCLTGS